MRESFSASGNLCSFALKVLLQFLYNFCCCYKDEDKDEDEDDGWLFIRCYNKIFNIYWVMPNLWDLFNLVNNQDKY